MAKGKKKLEKNSSDPQKCESSSSQASENMLMSLAGIIPCSNLEFGEV